MASSANVARLFCKNISDLALVRGVNLPIRAKLFVRGDVFATIFDSRKNVPGSKCPVWPDLKVSHEPQDKSN